MTNTPSSGIPANVQALLDDETFRNRVAQAHSRAVLQRLAVPAEQWPRYDTELTDKLHHTAHYLLWHGLQLKDDATTAASGDRLLKDGAEILEYLYGQAPAPRGDALHQCLNAALGYYIAGYYARAFVLMQQLEISDALPQELAVLRQLLIKDLAGLRQTVDTFLLDPAHSDEAMVAALRDGVMTEEGVLSHVLHTSLNYAFSVFLEYPRTGRRVLLEQALNILDHGIATAQKTHFADWWWLLTCTRYIFREYDTHCLWTQLNPLNDDDPQGSIVAPYIRGCYRRRVPIIELWRSQTMAVPFVNDPDRQSYCLSMPTSAGKTRVAEVAILRFLLDTQHNPDAKCLYIAPYRSLAVELEQSLQQSFLPLGVRVSELYGGFELSATERLLLERTRVMIATPEKIDALLRYSEELAAQIRLVILDEGHMVSLSDRGLRYELFVHRLVRRFADQGVRYLLLSAVLPNPGDFAQWIAERAENVIQTTWRPSRQLVGELIWDGERARIEYREANHEPLGHPCFVPRFITPTIDRTVLRTLRRRRRFPDTFREVVATAAVTFALQGTTMVFCGLKRSIEPMADEVLRALAAHFVGDESMAMPALPTQHAHIIERCLRKAEEFVGADHPVIRYLQAGIVVHHGDIPKPLRVELETVVRAGCVRLIIASTTLAQGVNFPIQTVLVYGLSHGLEQISPPTFWNICGRAGRGLMENEGQILFAVDRVKADVTLNADTRRLLNPQQIAERTAYKRNSQIQAEQERRNDLIQGYRSYRIRSAIWSLLEELATQWNSAYGSVQTANLCDRLAEHDLTWVTDETRPKIERLLLWLDTELLALSQEADLDVVSPDSIQDIMRNSLALIQMADADQSAAWQTFLHQAVLARLQHIFRQTPDAEQRHRFYRLGLPLSDCQRIEQQQGTIIALFQQASVFETWSITERCAYLIQLADVVLTLDELQPNDASVDAGRSAILNAWLQGFNPSEIAALPEIQHTTTSAARIATYIDDVFGYKLPWGLNALTVYATHRIAETGDELPSVVQSFADLVKYGVYSIVASTLLAFGLESRPLALLLASAYDAPTHDPGNILLWFLGLDEGALRELGLTRTQVARVRTTQLEAGSLQSPQQRDRQVLTLSVSLPRRMAIPQPGDVLRFRRNAGQAMFSLQTLRGGSLGDFRLSDDMLGMNTRDVITCTVESSERVDGITHRLRVAIEAEE
ncbi:MAG: hypothetical protein CYG59_16185 [Chloroflexi bacterium]|nr:MAG: hypothetical protein CYG59_16185 [Chloroflexota bacterium]